MQRQDYNLQRLGEPYDRKFDSHILQAQEENIKGFGKINSFAFKKTDMLPK